MGIVTWQRIRRWKLHLTVFLLMVSIGLPILLNVNLDFNSHVQMKFRFPQVLDRLPENVFVNKQRQLNKVILFWVPYFSASFYDFGLGQQPFLTAGCRVSSCETTTDPRRLSMSDAIIFHLSNVDSNYLPSVRYADQRWVFFTMESPTHAASTLTREPITDLHAFNGHFNWTVSYRNDSDIWLPYFSVVNMENDLAIRTPPGSMKKRLISWLVSNCRTNSKRENYVNELKNYVPVDIYGRCGRRCKPRSICNRLTFDNHKFYLSFENSVCRDYVTEKFSNALMNDIDVVPIVYGGADYSKIAPPHSYIDVQDFESPAHLANFLIYLDNNETAYREYFKWKSRFVIRTGVSVIQKAFCDLCEALHADELERPKKVYMDLHSWWIVDGSCKTSSSDVPLGYPQFRHRMSLATLELAHGFPRGP